MYQHMRGASDYMKISKKVLPGRAGQATVGKVRYATLEMHSAGVENENTLNQEMGHVFGLLHEHQREDRDTYIRVPYTGSDYDIIRHDNRYWFLWFSWTQPNATTYATPYDYHSVMHYRRSQGNGAQDVW